MVIARDEQDGQDNVWTATSTMEKPCTAQAEKEKDPNR